MAVCLAEQNSERGITTPVRPPGVRAGQGRAGQGWRAGGGLDASKSKECDGLLMLRLMMERDREGGCEREELVACILPSCLLRSSRESLRLVPLIKTCEVILEAVATPAELRHVDRCPRSALKGAL